MILSSYKPDYKFKGVLTYGNRWYFKISKGKNKLTLKALSKISDVGQSTISDIENGLSKNPRRDILSKLASALGISVNDFFIQEYESPKSQKLYKNEPLKSSIIPK